MLRLAFASVSVAAGALINAPSAAEMSWLQTNVVQELAKDSEMVYKLQVLGGMMRSNPELMSSNNGISLLQVAPAVPAKKYATVEEAAKDLQPIFENMKNLDPKGAQMLQGIIQMVTALGQQKKSMQKTAQKVAVAETAMQKKTESKLKEVNKLLTAKKSQKTQKKAFMQLSKDSKNDNNHFAGWGKQEENKSETAAVDPAVMEERLMRIQPILLKLKTMNSKLFGGLANVANTAERTAENEVVTGSFK